MRSQFILTVAAWSLLVFGSEYAVAANATFHSPATAQANQDRDLLERAAYALERYVAVCRLHERRDLTHLVTRHLAVEYLSASAGIVRPAADLTASPDLCVGARALAGSGQLSDLWVFPTDAPDAVYVQFGLNAGDRPNATSADHVAMLIMHGDRIASLRIFVPAYDHATGRERLVAERSEAGHSGRKRLAAH
jgi:hypothetical protein